MIMLKHVLVTRITNIISREFVISNLNEQEAVHQIKLLYQSIAETK